MKHNLKLVLSSLLLLTTLIGCSTEREQVSEGIEKKFQTLIPVIDMNKSFQIKVDNDQNTFQRDTDIRLIINNKSSHSITFALESYIKMLIIRHQEWMEVGNVISYSGLLQILPQGTLLLDTRTTRVQPILISDNFENTERTLLRIVMIGELTENDKPTGKMVGSYVDVYITP